MFKTMRLAQVNKSILDLVKSQDLQDRKTLQELQAEYFVEYA